MSKSTHESTHTIPTSELTPRALRNHRDARDEAPALPGGAARQPARASRRRHRHSPGHEPAAAHRLRPERPAGRGEFRAGVHRCPGTAGRGRGAGAGASTRVAPPAAENPLRTIGFVGAGANDRGRTARGAAGCGRCQHLPLWLRLNECPVSILIQQHHLVAPGLHGRLGELRRGGDGRHGDERHWGRSGADERAS